MVVNGRMVAGPTGFRLVGVAAALAVVAGGLAVVGAVRSDAGSGGGGGNAASSPADGAGAGLVFARGAGRLTSIDADRGEVAVSVRGAISSLDGSRIFQTVPYGRGGDPELRVLHPRTGDLLARQTVPAGVVPRVVSYDGSVAALMAPDAGSEYGFPAGRSSTDLVIATPGAAAARTHTLDGNFEPEAFSLDGSHLFLLKYVPAEAPRGYLVRQLDLATGDVSPVDSPDIGPRSVMGGTARSQVMSPDGRRLYTLYSVPAGVPDRVHGTDMEHGRAFIHVLDLDERWAHCLPLPSSYGRMGAANGPMAVSPDGNTLYVANADDQGGRGELVAVDTHELTYGDVAHGAVIPGAMAAAVGSNGDLYVAGYGHSQLSRLQLIDGADLHTIGSWGTGVDVGSIALAPDGRLLLASLGSPQVVLVEPGGTRRRTIDVPGHSGLTVGPASVSLPGPRDVLQCAC